jgi:GNAT superfamily N-acetyltransferase
VQIVVDTDPSQADHDVIRAELSAYNSAQTGIKRNVGQLAVLLKDDAGQTVGGLWGITLFGWLYVDMLYVPDSLRGQNLGTGLMEAAERFACDAELTGIWLDTFSFQARPFYEKLGFGVFGTIENFPVGGSRYFLRKYLSNPLQNERIS